MLEAEAAGEQEKGLAAVRVKEADAQAIEKKMLAEAKGAQEQGNGPARVREAEQRLGRRRDSRKRSPSRRSWSQRPPV